MLEGRDRLQWSHTSHVLAMLLNVHRTRGRAMTAADWNPYLRRRPRRGEPLTKRTLHKLKRFFDRGGASRKRPAEKGRRTS